MPIELDPTVYAFPWNIVAWVAVTVGLLAIVFAIGAVIDGVIAFRTWWIEQRQIRRYNRMMALRRQRSKLTLNSYYGKLMLGELAAQLYHANDSPCIMTDDPIRFQLLHGYPPRKRGS